MNYTISMGKTTIQISTETLSRFKTFGKKGESHDTQLNRMMNELTSLYQTSLTARSC
jgi:hypothetical protein